MLQPLCPHCHEPAVAVRLDGSLFCNECQEPIDADQVRQLLARWQAVLEWAAQAPKHEVAGKLSAAA